MVDSNPLNSHATSSVTHTNKTNLDLVIADFSADEHSELVSELLEINVGEYCDRVLPVLAQRHLPALVHRVGGRSHQGRDAPSHL